MGSQKTGTSPSWEFTISAGNGNPGRSIFSDVQWLSLARSLQLSGRELDIVQCIFDDQTETTMARRLDISPHTVHSHLERMYRKLAVSSRSATVVRIFAEFVDQQSPTSASAAGRKKVTHTGVPSWH